MLTGKKLKGCLWRLPKDYLNIKHHVKLRRNTSPTELMQQEKALVFSLIKENAMSKKLRITLALTPQKVSDFLVWIPQMLASKKHPVSLIDGVG